MTIIEFKDVIEDFFSSNFWDINIKDSILEIIFKDNLNKLTISQQELDDFNEKLQKNSSGNNYELFYNNTYYEAILMTESLRYPKEEDIKYDSTNGIEYQCDNVSKELLFSMLLNQGHNMKTFILKRIPLAMFKYKSRGTEETNIIDFFADYVLRSNSLKIITKIPVTFDKIKSYALSYTYNYMYNRQLPIYLYSDAPTVANLAINTIKNNEFDSPKKTYTSELVSYYYEAMSSNILPYKYLSFYHILEHFYERIFLDEQIKKVKEIITNVSFSYKRNKDIVKLIKSIQQKNTDNEIVVNEKNALSLLIKRYINQSDFKSKLAERNGEDFLSCLNNKVSFSDGNAIIFSNDESQFVKTLTDRIYKTRNSIVHSKESLAEEKKNNMYKRVRDDKDLLQEIALIQVMAEIMINADSKPI